MGMEYKSAVKIMDDVVKHYLRDYVSCTAEKIDAQRRHIDQIAEAYSRIRNG